MRGHVGRDLRPLGRARRGVPQRRDSPAECIGVRKSRIGGEPDPKHISPGYAERRNLTLRMSDRRFTRLTNAVSKKVENQALSASLHCMHDNFRRIHKTLRVTPAMAARIADRLWDVAGPVAVLEQRKTAQLAARAEAAHRGGLDC